MGDTSTLIRLYQKVAGGSVFDLKAYLEYTEKVNISSVWKVLTFLFVNFSFIVLDLVVGFFSLILSFFDKVDLYNTYKQTVYTASKSLFQAFLGNGHYTHSIIYVLVAISAFVIFISSTFSKGDVGKRLLHLMVVLMLGLGYYGTMQNTSGGLYVLDSIHNLSTSASEAISKVSLTDPQDGKRSISQNQSVTDNYIAKTAYAAYLYVNTGRLDGKYLNNQTGQLEDFDDSKVLGVVKNGTFQKANTQERDKKGGYLDDLGTGADEGKEKNRWVSAVFDYLPIKLIYVLLKIIEAVILGIPLVMIQCLGFLAQLVIIILIAFFPLALVLSLVPRLQDMLFNTMKLMGGASLFPALVGFMTLMVFYVEALVTAFVSDGFSKLSQDELASFGDYLPALELTIQTFLEAVVLIAFWKNKARCLSYLLGQNNARVVSQLADKVSGAIPSPPTPKELYDQASDVATASMVAFGAGAGTAMMAKEHLGTAFAKLTPDYDDAKAHDIPQEFDETDSVMNPEDLLNDEGVAESFSEIPDYDEEVPDSDEQVPNLDELMSDSTTQGALPDYDETVPEGNLSEELPDLEQTDYDTTDIPDQSFEKEPLPYEQVEQPELNDLPVVEELIDTPSMQEDSPVYDETPLEPQSSDFPSAIDDPLKEEPHVLRPRPKSPKPQKRTSQNLPESYKVHQLEEELINFQMAPDLGELQARTPFERGLRKTLSKQKQYEHNVKRMSYIEKELARLRGDGDD